MYSMLKRCRELLVWNKLGKRIALDVALGLNYLHSRCADATPCTCSLQRMFSSVWGRSAVLHSLRHMHKPCDLGPICSCRGNCSACVRACAGGRRCYTGI